MDTIEEFETKRASLLRDIAQAERTFYLSGQTRQRAKQIAYGQFEDEIHTLDEAWQLLKPKHETIETPTVEPA